MGAETETTGGQSKRGGGSRSHNEAMAALYRDDPEFAVDLISNVLEDGDPLAMQMVLRQLAIMLKDGRVVPK